MNDFYAFFMLTTDGLARSTDLLQTKCIRTIKIEYNP